MAKLSADLAQEQKAKETVTRQLKEYRDAQLAKEASLSSDSPEALIKKAEARAEQERTARAQAEQTLKEAEAELSAARDAKMASEKSAKGAWQALAKERTARQKAERAAVDAK